MKKKPCKRSKSSIVRRHVYGRWYNILKRCENPKSDAYCRYGKKGIGVCEEWHTFQNFFDWMLSVGYDDARRRDIVVDRIDGKGDYSPENCRLVTPRENTINRECTILVTDPETGERRTITEHSYLCGKSAAYLSGLLSRGEPMPPVLEESKRYEIVAYASTDKFKSFRTKEALSKWWRTQLPRVTSCLCGGAKSVAGLDWFYVNTRGEKHKFVRGAYVKVED